MTRTGHPRPRRLLTPILQEGPRPCRRLNHIRRHLLLHRRVTRTPGHHLQRLLTTHIRGPRLQRHRSTHIREANLQHLPCMVSWLELRPQHLPCMISWRELRPQHHRCMDTTRGRCLPHPLHTPSLVEQFHRPRLSTLINPHLRFPKNSRRKSRGRRRHLRRIDMLLARDLPRPIVRILQAPLATARMRRLTTGTSPARRWGDKDPMHHMSRLILSFLVRDLPRPMILVMSHYISLETGLQFPMTPVKPLLRTSIPRKIRGIICRRPEPRHRFHRLHPEAT